MSELQFPKDPVVGQEYDFASYKYYWDGVKWKTNGVGNAPRDDLEPKISSNTSKVFEALKRSYAIAGFNLVAGSFEEGGVLSAANDVMITASGAGYTWGGAFPKNVPPLSSPETTGGISTNAWQSQVSSNAVIKTFPTVADMLLMPEENAVAAIGSSVKTDVNNSVSKVGGWDYRITTLANERITRGDPAWVPDGGLSPDNIIIGVDHYLKCGDGQTYVAVAYNDGTMLDSACGVIGHAKNGIYDDGPALNKLISYCRNGKAIGTGFTGGTVPRFTPRSKWYISETINLIDFNVSTDWGNSELRPSSPISAIAYEQSGTEFSGLQIWYDHLSPQAVYEAQKAAFVLSSGQPVAITSESPFSKISRVWIYYAYQGFRLRSQAPEGGLFWQFSWEQCLTWNTMDYGWYLWSVSQVSTTTQFNKCHAKNVTRTIVKHNSKNYAALQHMLPTTVVEPGVTTGWRDYWLEMPTYSDTRSAWASGTFYSTCGKAYFGRNVQTVTFDDSSADGGVNFEEGNVMNFFNSGVTVNSFHLEGTNLNFANRCPIIIDADCSWDFLYMYDLRVQLPLETDECAMIGGTLGRGRFLTLQGTRNHAQNATRVGQFRYVRAARDGVVDFTNISVGPGVDPDYVTQKEMCNSFTSARWNSRVSDLMFTLVAAGSYAKVYETVVPATGSPTAVYQEFSDLLEITVNCGNTAVVSQQVGKYAKVRVSAFVQSGAGAERSVYDVSVISGDTGFIYQTFNSVTRTLALWVKCSNPGQLGIVSFCGRAGGYDTNNGKSRMLYAAVRSDGATVEAMEGFAGVARAIAGGEVQILPDGSYTSGTINLKSFNIDTDSIVELRVVIKSQNGGAIYHTVLVDLQYAIRNSSVDVVATDPTSSTTAYYFKFQATAASTTITYSRLNSSGAIAAVTAKLI